MRPQTSRCASSTPPGAPWAWATPGLASRASRPTLRTPELGLEYLTRYDARQRAFLEHNTVLRYATCCWEVGVHWINRERAGFPNENDVRLVFDLKTGRGPLAPPRGAPAGGVPSPPATGAAAGGPIPGAAAPPAGFPEPGPRGRPVDGPATGR